MFNFKYETFLSHQDIPTKLRITFVNNPLYTIKKDTNESNKVSNAML